MGAFLSLEIHTGFRLYEGNLKEVGMTVDSYMQALKEEQAIALDLYNLITEEEGDYFLRLKDDAIIGALLPFLEQFYIDFYHTTDEYADILDGLKKCNTYDKLIEFSEDSYIPFMRNHISQPILLLTGENKDAPVYSNGIMLSMEGKISFEELNKSLSFFELMIKKAYPDYPIARSVTVSIV